MQLGSLCQTQLQLLAGLLVKQWQLLQHSTHSTAGLTGRVWRRSSCSCPALLFYGSFTSNGQALGGAGA
jgi:hypothetical protein